MVAGVGCKRAVETRLCLQHAHTLSYACPHAHAHDSLLPLMYLYIVQSLSMQQYGCKRARLQTCCRDMATPGSYGQTVTCLLLRRQGCLPSTVARLSLQSLCVRVWSRRSTGKRCCAHLHAHTHTYTHTVLSTYKGPPGSACSTVHVGIHAVHTGARHDPQPYAHTRTHTHTHAHCKGHHGLSRALHC